MMSFRGIPIVADDSVEHGSFIMFTGKNSRPKPHQFYTSNPAATPEEQEAARVAARLLGESSAALTLAALEDAIAQLAVAHKSPNVITMHPKTLRAYIDLLDADRRYSTEP